MKFGKLAAVAVLSVASAGFSAPVFSAPVSVDIRFAPPAPRHEWVPADRPGYVWAPGYWDYRDNRYRWVSGRWVRERPGYYYAAPTWVQDGDRWVFQRNGWQRGYRDRDRDGIPNRYDRDRDNDGVPNRYDRDHRDRDRDRDGIRDGRDRDRDGDGVSNRYDSRPDNPRRY